MNINKKYLAGASALVLAVLGSNPAFAAGTSAGDTITNIATLNYKVGTVDQDPITAQNDITVDRKVSLTVVELGSADTSVVPGQTGVATTFTVTNTSNATIDIGLAATNLSGVAGPHGGTDNFDPVTAYTYYIDDGDNVFDAGDTLLSTPYLDEVGEDASVVVHVVTSIVSTRVNNDLAVVSLAGQAREGGTASSQGAVIAATAGGNTAGVDTVLADADGIDDGEYDGIHTARDAYLVTAPVLTVSKLSRVISDPVNGTTDPKMIPGAVVEYCITVANASGAAAATDVIITDPLPSQTTYVSAFGVYEGGSVSGGVCSGGAATGSESGGTVEGDLGTVAANTTETVYFRVTIN